MKQFNRSFPGLLLVCGLLTGFFDFFFHHSGPSTGWVRGAYLLLIISAAGWRGGLPDSSPKTRFVTVALLGLVIAYVVEPSKIAFLLSFAGLAFLLTSARQGWPERFSGFFRIPLRFFKRVLGGVFPLTQDLNTVSRIVGRRKNRFLPALPWKGILILFIFGALFLGLFIVANPILEKETHSAVDFIFKTIKALKLDAPRIFLWGLTFSMSWGAFRARRKKQPSPIIEPLHHDRKEPFMEAGLLSVGLGAFNLLFAIQTLTDAVYLWGGASLPEGMTFASYSHRGAYPLLFTTLLAAIFVLLSFKEGDSPSGKAWPRRWLYLWMAQNVFLTVSSIWRLHLYVDAYGLTRWRIAAFLWMGLVAVGIFLLTCRIHRGLTNEWLCKANTWVAGTLLYLCCFPSVDGFIAWHNVRHCREVSGAGFSIDSLYLSELGPEALPALEELRRHVPEKAPEPNGAEHLDLVARFTESPDMDYQAPAQTTQRVVTTADVDWQIQRIKQPLLKDMGEWRAWTWRRWRLVKGYL